MIPLEIVPQLRLNHKMGSGEEHGKIIQKGKTKIKVKQSTGMACLKHSIRSTISN